MKMILRILLLTLGALFWLAACGANSTPLPPLPLKIVARDTQFEPNILTGTVNQAITLTIENQGAQPHSFVIDELKINSGPIEPGKQATVTIVSNRIRTYSNGGALPFYSDMPGDKDAGLVGNLSFTP
ncbi:MAG: hypothetical protein B6D41_03735 [Chloroflexi bacterium UTCFX4]|nr:MAG: hypothetical protein B6D41_03735 [Chloroflexi bacterium UTCFX4]